MTIDRGYSANPKIYDRMGRITPNTQWSKSDNPHIPGLIPAPWLPVQRYDNSMEYWKVISSGKVVALDGNGDLVPAGLKKSFNVATGTVILTYTADDVTNLTTDLTTGSAVAAATTYTEADVTAALKERGLIRHDQRATDFISKPIGFANYDCYSAPGTDHYNPATLKFNNFRPQAKVSVVCDYALTFPLLPYVLASGEAVTDLTGEAAGYLEDLFDATNARTTAYTGFFSSTQIAEVTRYSGQVSAGDDVVVFMTENYPIANVTAQTPITTSTDSCLVREVDSIASISAAGDYYVDAEVGAIFLYEEDGDAVPSPWVAGTTTITYYHYATEVTSGTQLSTYACATGNLEYGDFLTYDVNSNLIKAVLDIGTAEGYSDADGTLYSTDPDYSGSDDDDISIQLEKAIMGYQQGIVGQVIGTTTFGEETELGFVKTAFQSQTAANMQTPGSATGGRTDQLTYSNSADTMIIVNAILR
jgi:hypothetical protein